MTSMLVHDLRSPLTVVMGSLALMERAIAKDDIENLRQLQDMAHSNSQRILGMVNQLLDISKLESGQFPLDRQTVDVRPILNRVQERFAPLAAESNIQLSVSVADNLPMAKLDRQIIGRVLNNLVDNALKFTPEGGRVEIWARPDPEIEPVSVMMGVSDTGPGIPADALPRLFEKFQQVDDTQGRRTGTGLGLPFCKLAVEAHGGCIWVETTVGEGSTFVIAFDTCPADAV
jgi:signal transduction histidine kinase